MNESLTIASRFDGDLAEILGFFLEADVPQTATRFLEAVANTLDDIAAFPDIGTSVEVNRRPDLKILVRQVLGFRNYLIAYRRISNGILISRLVLGNRDLPNVL